MTPQPPDLTPVQIIANPAVTVGRAFTDTFAGIAPASVPGFVVAQLAGLLVGVGLLLALYPDVGIAADEVVAGHPTDQIDQTAQRSAPLVLKHLSDKHGGTEAP